MAESSSCVPLDTSDPLSITMICDAFCTVESRCAITSVVRFTISLSNALKYEYVYNTHYVTYVGDKDHDGAAEEEEEEDDDS